MRSLAVILALSLVVVSCGGGASTPTARWQVDSSLGPEGQVTLELSVVGIPDSQGEADDEGIFLLDAVDGPQRVFATTELPTPDAGEVLTPLTWSAMLSVGEYLAYWGSRDDAVSVRIDVEDGGFGVASPEPAQIPDEIVPGSVSRFSEEALEDVREREDAAELFLAGYEVGIPTPGSVAIEIGARSAISTSVYRYELVGDRLELVSVSESPAG